MYDFVSLYGEKKWGVSAYYSNCGLIANYINPILGQMEVQSITPKVADKYVKTLQKTTPVGKKIENAFYSIKTDLRDVHVPKEESAQPIDAAALIEQLQQSPELMNTLAQLLASQKAAN